MYLAQDESGDYIRDTTPQHTIIVFEKAFEARQFGTAVPLVKYLRPRPKKVHWLDPRQDGNACGRSSRNYDTDINKVSCTDCQAEYGSMLREEGES